MTIFFAATLLAVAQGPAAPVDHSAHGPAQHAAAQHSSHQQGQQQSHAEMMKHCHEMMAKMHTSMHEGHGSQQGTQADQHKGHSGH